MISIKYPTPVAVLHSNVRMAFSHEVSMEWNVCYPDRRKDNEFIMKKIDRNEALEIIDKYGLHVAFANEDGKLFDTSDGAFKRKYKGYYIRTAIETVCNKAKTAVYFYEPVPLTLLGENLYPHDAIAFAVEKDSDKQYVVRAYSVGTGAVNYDSVKDWLEAKDYTKFDKYKTWYTYPIAKIGEADKISIYRSMRK